MLILSFPLLRVPLLLLMKLLLTAAWSPPSASIEETGSCDMPFSMCSTLVGFSVSIFFELSLPTVTLAVFLWCFLHCDAHEGEDWLGCVLFLGKESETKALAWPEWSLFITQHLWSQVKAVNDENTTAKLLGYIPSPKGRVWSLTFRLGWRFFSAQFIKQIMGTKTTVAVGSVWTGRLEIPALS